MVAARKHAFVNIAGNWKKKKARGVLGPIFVNVLFQPGEIPNRANGDGNIRK
jgi:hypothetical protein